jgi:hypothetical protein
MRRAIQYFLAFEAAAFLLAAAVHSGALIGGFAHRQAAIAESTIGIVSLVGLAGSLLRPRAAAVIGLYAQAFALLGTTVGLVMVAIGVGPQTVPDIVFHVGIFGVLAAGLATAFVQRRAHSRHRPDH